VPSVNVWAGIADDYEIGPHEIKNHVGGAHYTNFLEKILPLLLENVSPHMHKNMWFLLDGVPPDLSLHFAHRVCNWLDNYTLSRQMD
jgi:hypothetical protein